MRNFFQASANISKKEADKGKEPRQHGIIAVYKNGGFYAKLNNKLYPIENYKLARGKVYSKPENDAHIPWTMKDITKDLETEITMDNYLKLDKMWASLYHGQVITGRVQGGMFKLVSKTDKLF